MDFLYNNKFLVSVSLGLIISVIYYKYIKVHSDPVQLRDENTGEIYQIEDSDNLNRDKCLYIFIGIGFMTFIILYMTEETIDDVMGEIDMGDPGF